MLWSLQHGLVLKYQRHGEQESERFLRAAIKSCLEAPVLLRRAATITSVSKTIRTRG
jgi:hypothetical protein